MRSIANGITLAQRCNVDYSIIWYLNDELNARFEDVFKYNPLISDHIVYPSFLKYFFLYSVPRKKNLYLSSFAQKHYGIVLTDASQDFFDMLDEDGCEEKVFNMVNSALKKGKDCYIQSGLDFYTYRKEFYRELFEPNKLIAAEVSRILSSLGESPIGIHIRRTDNEQSIIHSPDELFISEIQKKVSQSPGQRFYLATDDQATKTKFSRLFGDIIKFSEEKADRKSCSGIIHAATEMFVLSRMSEILGSHYSTFSAAASFLGNIPLKQLYI